MSEGEGEIDLRMIGEALIRASADRPALERVREIAYRAEWSADHKTVTLPAEAYQELWRVLHERLGYE